ncbi:MAG: hypothetical protein RIS44_1238 [Pseudomonadota bacterium]|jgi:hypothetical protein
MHRLDSRLRGNDAGRRYQHITLNRTLCPQAAAESLMIRPLRIEFPGAAHVLR